ncbi:MAG TPA: DUF423 domain-containing protein [Gillisia sp.]|nr:DUF423 domain-containing protein [Gillisia sp.]
MHRRYYIAGFAFGLTGVILGAFATHGLKPVLSPAAMDSFETGIQYQIYHALLLLLLGNMKEVILKQSNLIFYLLVFGIILFSGSIYFLATREITNFNIGFLGPVTPLGGSLLILCWIILLWRCIKLKNK